LRAQALRQNQRSSGLSSRAQPDLPHNASAPLATLAAVALEMVSEAGAAIRELEEQCAQAVVRAQDLAKSIGKQLESTDLPPNFHPAAIRVSGVDTPGGANGATCDGRS